MIRYTACNPVTLPAGNFANFWIDQGMASVRVPMKQSSRRWLRFRLTTAFSGMTVIAMLLMCYRAYHAWFLETYPGYYVHSLDYVITDGDTVDEVAKHFHSVNNVSQYDMDTVLEVWKSRGWEIKDGDQILHFSVKKGHGKWCQFRNGRLINHEQPGDVVRIMELNNQPCPPWYLRWF